MSKMKQQLFENTVGYFYSARQKIDRRERLQIFGITCRGLPFVIQRKTRENNQLELHIFTWTLSKKERIARISNVGLLVFEKLSRNEQRQVRNVLIEIENNLMAYAESYFTIYGLSCFTNKRLHSFIGKQNGFSEREKQIWSLV